MALGPQILAEIDVAAGGLLIREANGGRELCIVHRPRHDDWALPKGHPEAHETLREAALREVLEETGCHAEIEGIVAPLSYLVDETPKLVVFYAMRLLEAGAPRDETEVDGVAWLSPEDAVARLSYTSEKNMLSTWIRGARPPR